MRTKKTSLIFGLLALVALATGFATATAATSNANKKAARKGANYLNSRSMSAFSYSGFKADAISALLAAKKGGTGVNKSKTNSQIRDLSELLQKEAPNYDESAGAAGKLLLAAVASGERPRCYGPADAKVDLIAMLNQYYDSSTGRYGTSSFDQALAMLGLKAAGHKIPSKARELAQKRRGKHGWNFAFTDSSGDDVESTALMIQALRAAGVKKSDSSIKKSYKWMWYQRNAQMGFGPDGNGTPSNANATALVIQAMDSIDKPSSKTKLALRKLQAKDGHWKLTDTEDAQSKVLSTSDSVLALSGMHYPVAKRKKADSSCVS